MNYLDLMVSLQFSLTQVKSVARHLHKPSMIIIVTSGSILRCLEKFGLDVYTFLVPHDKMSFAPFAAAWECPGLLSLSHITPTPILGAGSKAT